MNKRKIYWAILLICLLHSVTLVQAQLQCVARNDCGVKNAQPFLIKGNNYKLPDTFTGSKEAVTCNFGGTVIYAFNGMDIQADYQLEVVYLSDNLRKQRIVVDGQEIQAPVILEKGKEQRYKIDLPKKAYAYGQLVLVFEVLQGDNTLVSELNLYSSNPRQPVPFTEREKLDLLRTRMYKVDTTVDVESVLPVYTPCPDQVQSVYQPVLSLNGIWMFNSSPADNFYQSEVKGNEWKPIIVPGEWTMQGFTVDSACFAGYQTSFVLPEDWQGKSVRIRFDGVFSESVIYLNGQKVGQHEGGMTVFELDLSDAIHTGKNILSLKVKSESMADMLGSLTQYAAHSLGGIIRKVTLMALPRVHVSDMRVITDFDQDYRDADLKVYTTLVNESDRNCSNLSLRMHVDGLQEEFCQNIPEIPAGGKWSGCLGGKIKSPDKWTNESPNLYTIQLSVDTVSSSCEVIHQRFGFRKVQIQGNRLMVNGIPVKLRGVCRHEIHPLTGRVMSPELVKKDVELYRNGNCNFIRTSHYPPCEEFLEECDEKGLFVEVEAPICWVGHGANAHWKKLNYKDPRYYSYIRQADLETIHFYRNHPSVLFWSMANESLWNKEFAQVEVYVEKADPTRPHTFHDQTYGGYNNQGSTAPIANFHYPGPQGYKKAAESDRPMIFGEYCHLNVYNRTELVTDPGIRSDWAMALAPTWEKMYKTPGSLGGSIWSGIDDIFQLPDGRAVGYGAWGPIDGWRRPKPEYWDMKKIYSPIRVLTKSLSPSAPFRIQVENRYTFTNLSKLQVKWSYGEETGTAFCEVAPGSQGEFIIPVENPGKTDGLNLTFTDPRGFVADQYRIPVGKQTRNTYLKPKELQTHLKTKRQEYQITGKDFCCRISRSTGQILSMIIRQQEVICGGPWLMALPLQGGGCYPNHNANTPAFNEVCKDWKVESVTAEQSDKSVLVKVSGSYRNFQGTYTLLINADGEITADYHFNVKEALNPRQWGLVFESPVTYNTTFWQREGRWSVYPEDHISRPEGEASLFYTDVPKTFNPRIQPTWSWSYDCNELGSNDFRSTRRNIWQAGLKNTLGSRVLVISNGQQHWRSWLEKDRIRFLIADFVSPGNEMFLESHYAPYRRPLKQGDTIRGTIHLTVESPL